MEEDYK